MGGQFHPQQKQNGRTQAPIQRKTCENHIFQILVLFTDRMVTNCPMKLRVYSTTPKDFCQAFFPISLLPGIFLLLFFKTSCIIHPSSGCSAVGSAPALGAGCRRFESCHSDQRKGVAFRRPLFVVSSDRIRTHLNAKCQWHLAATSSKTGGNHMTLLRKVSNRILSLGGTFVFPLPGFEAAPIFCPNLLAEVGAVCLVVAERALRSV